MTKKIIILILAFLVLGTTNCFGYTKKEIQKRGFLQCGVSTGSPGFSSVDSQGRWTGLDVDFCRGLAAAVLGDATKVKFLPLAENNAFTALLGGEIDVLSRHSNWNYTRDSALAVDFAGVNYYDTQGIMVARSLGAESLGDLKKVRICSTGGGASEENLVEYLQESNIEYKIISFDTIDLAVKGFEGEACDLMSMQLSRLYGVQMGLAKRQFALILPNVIGKEPLGPVVRQGDDIWFDIVRWTHFAMLNAEELGITSQNIEEMKISNSLQIKKFFGLEGSGGRGLGLNNDWAAQVIRQVGNYGEIFERNLGINSAMRINRGLNNLWSKGGLQYAPPLR